MPVTYVRASGDSGGRCVATSTPAVLSNALTVFTITGGPIRISDLISYSTTANQAGVASTLQWSVDADDTVGAAQTITAASGSLASFAIGGLIKCDFTTINTAPVITDTTGVGLMGPTTTTGGGIYAPAGIITAVIAVGSTTGLFVHYLRYTPLSANSHVTAAF